MPSLSRENGRNERIDDSALFSCFPLHLFTKLERSGMPSLPIHKSFRRERSVKSLQPVFWGIILQLVQRLRLCRRPLDLLDMWLRGMRSI